MNAQELLKTWPTWAKAGAGTIAASPAFRMPVEYAERSAAWVPAVAPMPDDSLALSITLDDVPHVLRVADSEEFADLHALWSRRAELPPEVVLALAEKECGPMFQMLEDSVRMHLKVTGLAGATALADGERAFELVADEGRIVAFSLSDSPALTMALGRLEHLDVTHDAIRTMTREADARYAAAELSDEDVAALTPGDNLVFEPFEPAWNLGDADDGRAWVVGAEKGALAFAQLADDELPPVPPAEELRLVRGGRVLAALRPSRVGEAASFAVTELL